jgi:very-short-patch-repair endonuclease
MSQSHNAFRQYEERLRQRQEFEKIQRGLQHSIAQQQALALQIAREQERRAAEQQQREQRLQAEQQAREQREHEEQVRKDEVVKQRDALQLANQQRNASLQQAHQRMAEIRAKRPEPPYDTFAEQFFHKRWRELYPDIELIPQFRIPPFRVDFCHMQTKTVVELNGSIHSLRRVRNRDASRHRILEQASWHVLPFTNDETSYALDACCQETHAVIVERQGR